MSQTKLYYQHSGALNPLGLIYMLFFGTIGVTILGAIYGYAIFYIPFIYFNFFITLGFGAIVGLLIGYAGNLGKVRNYFVNLFFGLVFGVLAAYAGWVSWIYAFSEQKIFLYAPAQIFKMMGLVGETGAWSIFKSTPTGGMLYTIWIIEAIMIIGASVVCSLATSGTTPFCERCKKWIDTEFTIFPLEHIEDVAGFVHQLEQGAFRGLASLKMIDTTSFNSTKLTMKHCSMCQQTCFIAIDLVSISVGSNQEEKQETKTIVDNLIVPPEIYMELLNKANLADNVAQEQTEAS